MSALLLLPLLLVCLWLHLNDRFAPVFDMALFELRVRDVGTRHSPLVGLGGRLSRWPEIGCHPGPMAFYVAAPLYRLLGGSYWALRATLAALAATAIVLSLWMARRRAGTPGMVATGVVIVLLELGFGLLVLTEPWNPYVPVLWFLTFLLAIWCVFAGDVKFLPLAAAVGSLCGQTHISYLPACAGLSAVAFGLVLARWIHASLKSQPQRDFAIACGAAALTAVVVWTPVALDEMLRQRGNITIITEYLGNPPEPAVGLRAAVDLLLQRLDVWFLFIESFRVPGVLRLAMSAQPSVTRGAVLFALWLVCTAIAFKLRQRSLLALHATVAGALLIGLVSLSRVIGFPFVYVLFFAWIVGGLVFLSVVATVGSLLQARGLAMPRHKQWAAAAAAAFILVCSVRVASKVSDASAGDPVSAKQLAALSPDAASATYRGIGAAAGPRGRYLVTWEDALYGGGEGYGLVNELERRGIRAFLPANPFFAASVGEHRTIEPTEATARIHFANGGWITEAQKIPGSVQVAYADVRTPEARKEYERVLPIVLDGLKSAGRSDLVPLIDRNLSAIHVPGMGIYGGLAVGILANVGLPAAVFVLPPQ